ncbi:AB hydrolase-1 domain-containing protein [Fusarium keratoplasticum]|uniref:AB hydrolase-1 domain-containing protein n=1 Tax=Fusarium keratoplasticum TaxID=1328300 RepID=A0ACC0R7V0_9HYPO|nr:AB hydrolase-1 domain-containing protein [Fusarium keratoplasticum]KAI8675769.1 AB hydrolase-1 domain-containing protein [Fusarium keratoplasticum]KAI8682238.1 AB hydrolase-1 domain-containing protein [Fusarium keratoplasticum]
MSSVKPTIVFAPGAWHTADCFDVVREALHARDWTTEAVEYPSVGAEPPTKGLADDANAVRASIERLADEGKKVVLVVHSYGGLVGANAVEGLGYKQRLREGKTGGVILFVYLAAFVTPLGKSIKEMLGGQFLPWMRPEGDYVYADTPETIFYHDVEPEAQKKALDALKHQSGRVFTDTVTYEPWRDIDCFYFFCDGDQALALPIQQHMASLLGPDAASFHSQGSHSPFLSQPQEVVEGLEYAAKVGLEKTAMPQV